MITDKQGREWLLQKLHDDGLKYVVMDEFENIFITDKKPFDDVNGIPIGSNEKHILISGGTTIFTNIKRQKIYDIAEELGIVDWSKVEVDTPIFVRNSITETWKCRYFAEYKYGKVYTWRDGKTSWSNVISDRPVVWMNAELAFKE